MARAVSLASFRGETMLKWTFMLLSFVLCSLPGSTILAADAMMPLYTNKSRFRIPYRFDTAELARSGAVEIHLYVSQDLGKTWMLSEKVGIQQGKFEFTAKKEGEYWFAVRTMDGRGNLNPPGNIVEAGLVVIVDATPPGLKLDANSTQTDRIEISWNVSDSNLQLDSLIIEYREDQSEEWKRVHLIPAANGKTSWTSKATKTEVRGKILDRADNATTLVREVNIVKTSTPATPAGVPSPLRTRPSKTDDKSGEQPYVPDFTQPIASEAMPDLSRNAVNPNDTPLALTQPQAGEKEKTHPLAAVQENGPPAAMEKYNRTEYPEVLPGISSRQTAEENSDNEPYANVSASQIHKPKIRVVNTNQFQIGYQLEDVGPSGISAVDIYITENEGQRWWKYGQDRDLQSPATIEVPGDGEYGFAIRVKNGVGTSAPPPQAGERPEMKVKIDRTAPVVKFLNVKQGEGAKMNRIQFEWKVEDDQLAEKSVSLYAANTPEGPWEPVIGWQVDKGGFEWVFGKDIPGQLYFRLAVRDAAGNVTTSTTPTPIAMDLSRPTAKILDVAPLR